MKVRFLFGPKKGTEEHISPKDAKPLITAGFAEACDPADLEVKADGVVRVGNEVYRLPRAGDAIIPQPQWSLDTINLPGLGDHPVKKTLCIRMDLANQVSRWFGDPKKANLRAGTRWLNGFGREIPAEILKNYTAQWKANEHLRAPNELLNPPKEEPSGSVPVPRLWRVVSLD